jgi:tripartite-type tricarboxylate transporter receptor subunit TctC
MITREENMKKILFLVGAAVMALSSPAKAEEFPSKAVKLVIPFPAGAGANDVVGRFVADKLSKLWNQPVIVENRPGANSTIGAMNVIRSAPDGYTMMFTSANYAMTPAVADIPFDADKDLKPAALVGTGEYLLITGSHTKANTVAEFIEESKTRPMKYAGGTPGADLSASMFMEAAGIKMKRVPYGGTNDSLIDMLGGRLDFVVAAVGAQVGNIEEGKVKALAVTGPRRSKQLPNVPALRDVGLQAAELPTWWGIFVPAKTPADVVNKINASVDLILQDEDTKAYFDKQSVTPENMKPEAIATMVSSSIARYKELAAKNDLKAK